MSYSEHCPDCGLHSDWCCCSQILPHPSQIEIALLLHENESARPTTTSKIIQAAVPNCSAYTWQRKEPPLALLERLNAADTQSWLLFPADRPELLPRSRVFTPASSDQKTLIVVPDGTWKEVRKIVRKSPWLDNLPLLAFDPQKPSRYDLRRNPDADHLCTAETIIELLKLADEPAVAASLDNAFDLFLSGYKASKRG